MNKEETKFTPGPWETMRIVPSREVGIWEIGVESAEYVNFIVLYGGGGERHKADANLVAAAPTMYDYVKAKADAGDSDAKKIMEAINGNP